MHGELLRGVLAVGLLVGCSSGRDANSRELVAIVHLASTPAGSLSVSDDGSYTYLPDGKAQRQGTLSPSEFETLQSRTARPVLEALYAFAEKVDSEQCQLVADGYYLNSVIGGACFVPSNISDTQANDTIEYFVSLFAQKAATQ
jgi:hypothetical protein